MTIWEQILQVVISGVSMGAVYALAAVGFFVVYAITRVINFAQGEFVMLGGMLTATFYKAGIPLGASVLGAIAIAGLTGGVMWRLVLSYTRKPTTLSMILVTLGVAIVIKGVAFLKWGWEPLGYPSFIRVTHFKIGEAIIMSQSLVVMGGTLALLFGLFFLFEKTLVGKALKACSERTLASRLMGINPGRMALYAFTLAASIGAFAGALVAPLTGTSYGLGVLMSIKGFIAALAGGLNRAQGAIVGGIALGIIEALVAGFISSSWKEIMTLGVFAMVIMWRPQGIWGAVEIVRE